MPGIGPVDINPRQLQMTRVNARVAGLAEDYAVLRSLPSTMRRRQSWT